MKKILAMMLTAAMMLSMSAAVMADEATGETTGETPAAPTTPTYTDMSTVTIDKTYTVTNANTSYPNETFAFEVGETYEVTNGGVGSDAQDMPTVGTVSFETADGTATKSITVTLPTYTAVGIYSYTITETAGDTAGVEYYDDTIKLVVTVIQDGENKVRVAAVHTETTGQAKSNDIENVYKAGSLAVKKTVTGILGDKEKYFAITITLTGVDGKDYAGNVITVGETSYSVTDADGKVTKNPTSVVVGTPATFYLKDGETINLGNIPYGVTYSVTEEDLSDYNETITGGDANGSGTVDSAAETLVDVTNNKEGTVDTGISVDSIPYIAMLGVVAIGGTGIIVSKKRRSED